MSLYFTHSGWLWCALAAAVILTLAWKRSLLDFSRQRRRTLLATRACILAAIILALAGATLSFRSQDRETVMLVDVSESVADAAVERAVEIQRALQDSDRANLVKTIYFAQEPAFERDAISDEAKRETNLENAIFAAYAATAPDRNSRVILVSDGNETLGDAQRAIRGANAPLDVAPIDAPKSDETQMTALELPERARQGAPFQGTAIARSSERTRGTLSIYKNGALIEKREVELNVGENRYAFQATAEPNDKDVEITATLEAQLDHFLDNNQATGYVATEGAPQILMLAKNPDLMRNFTTAVRAQDLNIQTRPLEGTPTDSLELEKFDAVILADAPATSLSLRQMEALREYVGDFGGGLVVIGGENAFGAGGYGKTPLDEILPVQSNFEKDKEKPSLAIALVLDRSGSMEGDKLELTKDAAKGVVELLSPQDFISIIAFDDAPHEIAPLQNVVSPTAITETIGALAADGATNIYPALAKATDDLLRVNAKFKHIVLLTDGQSVPGDFEKAIRRATSGDITVSTVGIGSDCDRFLLEKLATDGAGRYYQCDDPRSVPQIFARETNLADRSTLNETPFLPVEGTSYADAYASISLEYAPPLLGNVVVEPKPTSSVALVTESGAPLLAFWRFGLGRVVAFTSDVDGRWSAEWLDWPDFGPFWAQTLRFAGRDAQDARSELAISVQGARAQVAVNALTHSGARLNGGTGRVTLVDLQGRKRAYELEQSGPGRYEASFAVDPDAKYGAQATIERNGEPVVALNRIIYAPKSRESDVKPANEKLLRALANSTRGLYATDARELATAASRADMDADARRAAPLRNPLLLLALALYVLDVYLRRGVFAKER